MLAAALVHRFFSSLVWRLTFVWLHRIPGKPHRLQFSGRSVVEIPIDGEIEPILADYVVHGIDQAATDHAGLILITINTPGGLDISMRAIIQAILRSPVPVVTYVYPRARGRASAGFYILLSADIAAMSPGTETGAASPIMEIGGQAVQIDERCARKSSTTRPPTCAATSASAGAMSSWP